MLKLIVDDTDKWDRAYERAMLLHTAYEFYGKPEYLQEFRQELPSIAYSLEQKASAATGKTKADLLFQAHHCYQMLVVDAFLRHDVNASAGHTLRLMDLSTKLDDAMFALKNTAKETNIAIVIVQSKRV